MGTLFERHPRATALTLLTVASLLLLLACEAAVRVAFPALNFLGLDRGMFAPVAGGAGFGNSPRFSGKAFGVEVKIDADGFRVGRTQLRPEPAAGGTVAFVGDSVTFGVGVKDENTFVALFAAAHPDLRVVNAAVIGYGLEDYVVALRLLLEQPGLNVRHVFLGICLNDVSPSGKVSILAATGAKPADAEAKESLLSRINAYLRERSKLYLLLKAALMDTSRNYFVADLARYKDPEALERELAHLDTVSRMLASRGVGLTVVLFPYEYQLRGQNAPDIWEPQRLIAARLERAGIPYLDVAGEFARDTARHGRRSGEYFLFNDPMHLSPVGHQVVAAAVGTLWPPKPSRREP